MMNALLAALPLIAVFGLMVGLKWSAVRAGLVGLVIAIPLSITAFGPDEASGLGNGQMLMGSGLEALFTATTILWIIFPALAIFHLQESTGSINTLRKLITGISQRPSIAALIVAWFFSLFMEGAAGFGTPVALAAPLLVGLGFNPVVAVAAALIGHSVAVSFGAVGTPVNVAADLITGDISAQAIGAAAGYYHLLLGWVMAMMVIVTVAPRIRREGHSVIGALGWSLVAAACFLLPMAAISRWVGPELPSLGGALIGGAVFVGIVKIFGGSPTPAEKDGTPLTIGAIFKAASPYFAILALILITRLAPQINAFVKETLAVKWTLWGDFKGKFQILYHPGTMLVLGLHIGAVIQGANAKVFNGVLIKTLKQLLPVAIALCAMLGLSRLMVHSGMIETLGHFTAEKAGGLWPLFSPSVGVLGTFVTGSATASNILFAQFQVDTANFLNIAPVQLVAAQTFGAAVGNIICPHNIIAASATVGLIGQEGQVLRKTVGACALYALLGGIVALILT